MRQTPRFIYEKVYCARGDIENRIKELLDGLQIDRTSCTHFSANQLRVLLTAAAYVLMQELRLRAARTACARTQVSWLRDRLLKLGVHVVRSARRLVSASAARDAAPRRVAAYRPRARGADRIARRGAATVSLRRDRNRPQGEAVAAPPSALAIMPAGAPHHAVTRRPRGRKPFTGRPRPCREPFSAPLRHSH